MSPHLPFPPYLNILARHGIHHGTMAPIYTVRTWLALNAYLCCKNQQIPRLSPSYEFRQIISFRASISFFEVLLGSILLIIFIKVWNLGQPKRLHFQWPIPFSDAHLRLSPAFVPTSALLLIPGPAVLALQPAYRGSLS